MKRAPHPLGRVLTDIERAHRESQVELAVECVEMLHMQYSAEPEDAALDIAGLFAMDARKLLEAYDAVVAHHRANRFPQVREYD